MSALLTTATYINLQDVPFDRPVLVSNGQYQDAPNVFLDEYVLMLEDGETQIPAGWELITGFGSYAGIFEPAQYITAGMSQQVAQEHEGQLVALALVMHEEDEGLDDNLPIGWAILTRPL